MSLLLNLFTVPIQTTRFLAFPVNSQLKYFQHQIGGGTGFLIRWAFIQLSFSLPDLSFFESSFTRKLPRSKYVPLQAYIAFKI